MKRGQSPIEPRGEVGQNIRINATLPPPPPPKCSPYTCISFICIKLLAGHYTSTLFFAIQKLLPHEQELPYVKEALARVTVETAKKMWPQRWDSFFADMDTLSKCGVIEIVCIGVASPCMTITFL